MKYIDLHVHTTFSDGTFTPKQVVKLAADNGLSAIAITDHDTAEGIMEALEAETEKGVEIISGIEFSTQFEGMTFHILALETDKDFEVLNSATRAFAENRDTRNAEMIELFKKNNIDISYDELMEFSNEKILGRSHFASLLVKKKYAQTHKDAFRRYLLPHCPTYVPMRNLAADETLKIIRNCRGVSVLAHPFYSGLNVYELEEVVKKLKFFGLMGIECMYADHTKNMENEILRLSKKYELVISGGSDFHGETRPLNKLGMPRVPYSVLEGIRETKDKIYK